MLATKLQRTWGSSSFQNPSRCVWCRWVDSKDPITWIGLLRRVFKLFSFFLIYDMLHTDWRYMCYVSLSVQLMFYMQVTVTIIFLGGRTTIWCIILSGEWTSSEDSSASGSVHQEPSQVPLKCNMGISGRSRTPQTTLEIYVYRHRCNLSATKTTKWIWVIGGCT